METDVALKKYRYNYRLVIEYDGSYFHGWQMQKDVTSVQVELGEAIAKALRSENFSSLQAAGRTDAGVHARAQVVNFRTDIEIDCFNFRHAVSSILKHKVGVLSIERVPDDFHSLLSATARQYQYRILNRPAPPVLSYRYVWHVPKILNLERLQEDAAVLIGEHDFSSFRGAGCLSKTPIKTVFKSEFSIHGSEVIYTIRGKGFLKQMVRNIVGTIIRSNFGKLKIGSVLDVLNAKDRNKAGVTAPACGLYLDFVSYGDWNSIELPL